MPGTSSGSRRVLNPVERISETLFGLIMTLSITGTLSIVSGGREEVRTMILSVLGCNIAWGIIDGVLYLIGAVGERGRGMSLHRHLRDTAEGPQARDALAEALPSAIADALLPSDFDLIHRRLRERETSRVRIEPADLKGAFAVFLLVVLSCVPLIIPFFVISEPIPALRVSNAVAVVMLLLGGYSLAKYAELSRVWTSLGMVVLGLAMVGLTIVLGG
jgi:hypothetical protein